MQDNQNTMPESTTVTSTSDAQQPAIPQPTVNATIASSVYPEPTKGFMGSVMEPVTDTPATSETSGGAMMLYVAAFTVAMTLIISIVATIAGLLEVVFNHIGGSESSSTGSYFGLDSYELKVMLWLVSSLIISTVIYVGLLFYIKKNDSVTLNSFSTKVYGFIYGGFMTIIGLAAISSFSNFIYSCLVPLVPKGAYDSTGSSWWVGVAQSLLTTLLLIFVLFYYFKKAKTSNRLS
jgi:hypothetical protein